MAQHCLHSTSTLRSVSGSFGEVQIVAAPNRVVLDIDTRNFDTAGFLHKDHALASLSLSAALELRDALSAAINAASSAPAPHPGVWSDATNRVARRFRGAAA